MKNLFEESLSYPMALTLCALFFTHTVKSTQSASRSIRVKLNNDPFTG